MTSRDFCFFLQGVFEVGGAKSLDEAQTEMVKRHLNLVFKHEIDPSMGGAEHQAKLNEVHSGTGQKPTFTHTTENGVVLRC